MVQVFCKVVVLRVGVTVSGSGSVSFGARLFLRSGFFAWQTLDHFTAAAVNLLYSVQKSWGQVQRFSYLTRNATFFSNSPVHLPGHSFLMLLEVIWHHPPSAFFEFFGEHDQFLSQKFIIFWNKNDCVHIVLVFVCARVFQFGCL